MSEAAWNKAFTQGSKAMQDRLRKVHAKNPKFQSWLQKSGHGAGVSVKQASKEVKATERAKKLAQQSLKAYGATKGQRMGGEDGSGETLRDTIAPLTRDQHSKVQAAQRAAKAAAKPVAPKKPLTKDQRLAAIAAAARKAKAKHDVPTMEPDDEGYDDLRDVHQSLHIRRGYNEEMEKVDEIVNVLRAMHDADKARSSYLKVGDNVRTIKMPIPGKVEKIKDGKVYFRHESGKLYATHAGNLRKEEVELEEADMSNKEKKKESRGHSPQRFGREILKGAAADRAIRKAMEKELTRMGEEVELEEDKMKDIVTDREETARLAAQKKPPFKPDNKKVQEGRGETMSYAKWLAEQAMMKKMKEMGMKEEVVNEVAEEPKHGDAGEYDYEGDMAKSQLRSIMTNAKRMHDMLEDNTNLPEWVQSKITLAEDYVLTATNYMESEMNEEVEQIDEITRSRAIKAQHAAERKKWVADAMDDHSPEGDNRFNNQSYELERQVGRLGSNILRRDRRVAARAAGKNRKGPGWSPEKPKTLGDRIRGLLGPKPPLGTVGSSYVDGRAASVHWHKEEVEQIDEATHFLYSGEVNGKEYEVTIPRHRDLGDYSDAALHRKLSKENPHLDHHEVTAIVHSGGEDESHVDVEHKGKKYTHHVINHQEPRRIYSEEVEAVDEASGTVAVTRREKELAKHYGDRRKITRGDVIRARIMSAAQKAMKGK